MDHNVTLLFFCSDWTFLIVFFFFEFSEIVGRKSRKDTRIVWLLAALDPTSCCFAKENERHLHKRKNYSGFATNSYSAAVNGIRFRYVECDQWHPLCAN